MKKVLVVLLCLVLTVSMFSGCGKKEEKKAPDFININGLDNGNATNEEITKAMGREPDATGELGNGGKILLYNDVIWLTVLFYQVQISKSEDHMLVSYCYTLDGDETMEDALESLHRIVSNEYGVGSGTNGDSPMYTWTSAATGNAIHLYALNETEIRLQYSFANSK